MKYIYKYKNKIIARRKIDPHFSNVSISHRTRDRFHKGTSLKSILRVIHKRKPS